MTGAAQEPVRELSMNECWALLRSARVGRLATRLGSRVEIFPLNFVVAGGTIVFRTGEGTKVAAMASCPDVAFEIDGYDETEAVAWSVVAHGRAETVSDADAFEALSAPLTPWPRGPKHRLMRIAPSSITGRRFAMNVRTYGGSAMRLRAAETTCLVDDLLAPK